MSFAKFMASKFNPTLSFDGVAIMLSCIVALTWFGTLKETVSQHTAALKRHEELIERISEGQKLISQNIAVLQTIVNERTQNHKP